MSRVVSSSFAIDVRAITNDVSNFVWTPTTDGSGNILDASWSNLPLLAWCEIANTNARTSLQSLLTAAGWTPSAKGYTLGALNGDGSIDGTFDAWCGMALDPSGGRAWNMYGGGHADSSVNGIWRIDLEKMEWAIEAMPSDPDEAGFEWSSWYRNNTSGSYSTYRDNSGTAVSVLADDMYDTVPDGKGTSRHTYNAVTYDSSRNRLMVHRFKQWRYALTGGALTTYRYNTSGAPWPWGETLAPGNFAHYDVTNDCTYLASIKQNSFFGFYKIAHATDTMSALTSVPGGYSGGHSFVVRDRLIYLIGGANNNRAVFNMDTETWSDTGSITGWPASFDYTDEMQPAVWVPDQSKILFQRKRDQLWYWIDPADWSMTAATFDGKTVPFKNFMGTKVFYYPARKVVMYVRGGNFNCYVMRVG